MTGSRYAPVLEDGRAKVVVIGGGPAGLMAAEAAAAGGARVDVYDAMPSVGRKFLLAGKGGMNITHAEPRERFERRYGSDAGRVRAWLDAFDAAALRAWVHGLGIATFVGTSGRVFPEAMKAGPLLRAWLRRLRESGVAIHVRHRWRGWRDAVPVFDGPDGPVAVEADAVVLALGGGSWSRLGSDGAWVPVLRSRAVPVADLRPANCGFECDWSVPFRERHAGGPVKNVLARVEGVDDAWRGEFVVAGYGVEGTLVYAASRALRDRLVAAGEAALVVDLLPDRSAADLGAVLARQKPGRSFANRLRAAGLDAVKAGLVRERVPPSERSDALRLAAALKAVRVPVRAPRPLEEAISTAGGVHLEHLDEGLMLSACPGVFCAGEMLDWEAPTGGYLLTACFASGFVAGRAAARWASGRSGARADPQAV